MSPPQRFADLQPSSERLGLTERLDEERRAVVSQASDLTPDELHARPLPATNLTIGRLVKHLSFAEDRWFQHKLLGLELPVPRSSVGDRDAHEWSFHSADNDSAEELLGLYVAACELSRTTTAACASMDTLAALPSFDKKPVNLRWLLADMIDETARHSGHADLIRDALGGLQFAEALATKALDITGLPERHEASGNGTYECGDPLHNGHEL